MAMNGRLTPTPYATITAVTAGGVHSTKSGPQAIAAQCPYSARRVSAEKRSSAAASRPSRWRFDVPPANKAPASGRRSFQRLMPNRSYSRPDRSKRRWRNSHVSRFRRSSDSRCTAYPVAAWKAAHAAMSTNTFGNGDRRIGNTSTRPAARQGDRATAPTHTPLDERGPGGADEEDDKRDDRDRVRQRRPPPERSDAAPHPPQLTGDGRPGRETDRDPVLSAGQPS